VAEDTRLARGTVATEGGKGELLILGGNHAPGLSRYVPLYEGKMIHQFDHRRGDFALAKDKGDADYREIPSPQSQQLADANFDITPRYWLPADAVKARLADKKWRHGWLMGWRDITNATNERTVIATVFPGVGVNHKMPIFFTETGPREQTAMLANFNSLTLDYVARQKVGGTNLAYFYLKQLPILPPSFYTLVRLSYIVPRVLELTYTSHAMAPFARDLGYDGQPFVWDEGRRAHIRADLDAFYARAYGLTRDELRYILDPADVKGSDYPSETFRVLKEREIRQHGEYRTQRLVLAAWDQMEADGTFRELGLAAGQVVDTALRVVRKPALGELLDGVWARATQQQNDAGAALTAILKAINGPTPRRTIRLAAAMMLEPHLLTSLLPDVQAREWRRLVGQEAEPRTGNVIGFAGRTNQGWGTAVSNHRGNGRLIEHVSAETWAPGTGLNAFDTAGWPDGRAGFVLEALGRLNLDTTVTSMPNEVRGWIEYAATA
jgi:hypothetical protein